MSLRDTREDKPISAGIAVPKRRLAPTPFSHGLNPWLISWPNGEENRPASLFVDFANQAQSVRGVLMITTSSLNETLSNSYTSHRLDPGETGMSM